MRFDAEVQRAVSTFQMGLLRRPVAGRTGELLGRGTGSSLEFQEYREYMPGDDIRHLDWAAFGRSDQLMIRLFREEISPTTEIILDGSRSMTTGGTAKPLVSKQLAATFALLSGQLGGRPALHVVDDHRPLRPQGLDALDRLSQFNFDAVGDLGDALASGAMTFKRQSARIVISDFLFPLDPDSLVRKLAADAASLWVVQVLNRFECDPTPLGGRRLIDVESGEEADLLINPQRIKEYLTRLDRLQTEMSRSCRRVHAPFVTVVAEQGLMGICRKELCEAGLLRVE